MKKSALFVAACAVLSVALHAQPAAWTPPAGHLTMNIWPGTSPGEAANMPPEVNEFTAKNHLVAGRPYVRLGNVSTPTITVFKAHGINTGVGVLVFPGGGYQILSMDLEGTEVCSWLNSIGVNCVLLKYRVPNTGPYPTSAAALQDAQRAMGLIREHASEWGIDPRRIGVLGFSAGGHLSAAISNYYDKRLYTPVDDADSLSCRPDFAVVLYPGYMALAEQNFAPNPSIHPTADTPPTFLLQAEDDPVHVENAVTYFMELKKVHVPAELHVYAQGGHGYGLRPTDMPITRWPKLVEAWMRTIKVLPAK